MTRFFITALALTLAFAAAAQKQQKQMVVLKDGSRVSGIILNDSSDFYKLRVTSPQTIAIKKSEVISMEPLATPSYYKSKSAGYYIHFSSSVLAGSSDWGNVYNLSFHLSNGYQFDSGFRIGVGTGIENLEVPLIPLYADVNYHPINSRISPYLYIKGGYSFALMPNEETYYGGYYYNPIDDSKGGLIFNTGVGVALYTWQKAAITMGVGYRYQKVTVTRRNDWWGGSSTREFVTNFNRIELQMGFVFR